MIDFAHETIVTLKDVARRLGVTTLAVRRWAAAGNRRLETARVGGRVFTSLEAVQRFSRQADQQSRFDPHADAVRLDAAEGFCQLREVLGMDVRDTDEPETNPPRSTTAKRRRQAV